jgi:hypothetical protein
LLVINNVDIKERDLPMTNFTPKKDIVRSAKQSVKHQVVNIKESLHASADALFFVRMFARAY